MTQDKINLMRSSDLFTPEVSRVREERRIVPVQPRLELDNLRSSTGSGTVQPLFTPGRRSRGKALEI